ncbi:MAG: hypothetical protein NZ521_09405, partial [Flammeovirgaceae bacterium]|nr:hypothetical protein [Flammeovirgaceae bacterium]
MKRLFFLSLLLLGSILYSCIPLEDIESPLVIPNIEDFPIREIYYYSDTMFIKATYTDNSTLDTVGFQVLKKEILPNENPWKALLQIAVSGRRFDTLYRIVVPNYKTQGDYHILLFARDKEGNYASISKEFKLGGDVTPPRINNLTLGLPQVGGRFISCRNAPITIASGVAIDNIEIRRVGISINGQESFTQVSTPTLNIRQVLSQFAERLRIPASATDGSIVSFAVIVEDGVGNRAVQTFEIVIDCD